MRRSILTAVFGVLCLSVCGTASAQSPLIGQPYLVPAGYEVFAPGSLVNYGGFNYVIQGDGTMFLSDQPPAPVCQPPVVYDQPTVQYTYGPWGPPPSWSQPTMGMGQWGWGTSPNQMGYYNYQPVNYHGHNGYYVQGNSHGVHYQGLFTHRP